MKKNFGEIRSREISRANSGRKVLQMEKKRRVENKPEKTSGKIGISSLGSVFFIAAAMLVVSAVYLYQVNDLATKGYEVRRLENSIRDLEKENKNIEIKEVELRSMYNLEKATQELQMIAPTNVSYVELPGPVAMK
jgi:hypothetical protein